MMVSFFNSYLTAQEHERKEKNKKGNEYTIIDKEFDYPTFMDFSKKIGVSHYTLTNWKKAHPEFLDTYKECQEIQQQIIVKHAITGRFNASFSIFAMKNIAGWRDNNSILGDLPQGTYVQIYRPEKYTSEELETASRATVRSF